MAGKKAKQCPEQWKKVRLELYVDPRGLAQLEKMAARGPTTIQHVLVWMLDFMLDVEWHGDPFEDYLHSIRKAG